MKTPKKRPSRKLGAAFLFGLLAAGCASVAQRETQTMRMDVGQSAVEPELSAEAARGDQALKVLLRRGKQGLKLSAEGGLGLYDPENDSKLAAIGAAGKGSLSARGDMLYMGSEALGPAAEIRSESGSVKVADRRYGGRVLLVAKASQVLLINEIDIEEYLKGVLPSEVPASWPMESLKAQAVAARSYAVWRVKETRRAGPSPFDLDDSVASQVYQGLEKRSAQPDRAVDATRGEVLSYKGVIAQCFFHSNSGGRTAGSDEAWGTTPVAGYLMGVADHWSEDQKHYRWALDLPLSEIEAKLSKAGHWSAKHGLLQEVVPADASGSGRWTRIRLFGSDGEHSIKAAAFRSALGADLIKSTRFRARPSGDGVRFDGLGWGHGVGMAQEGAKAMADAGKSYRQILDHYYPGTRWARLK